MAQFDWNGNGKDDAFDTFMDMKMVSEVIEDNDDGYDDFDRDDTCCEDYENCEDEPERDSETFSNTTESTLSFQDVLKQNLRTPEVVRNEKSKMELEECEKEAEFVLSIIKNMLIENAQNAVYTEQNGVTTVSCIYSLPQHFLRRTHKNNGEQLRRNQKTNFLLREPNLVYRAWDTFDIEPEYSFKFHLFMICLKELAEKEHINIENVIHEPHRDNVYPFPIDIDLAVGTYYLAVKATTRISDGSQRDTNNQDSANINKPKVTQEVLPPQKTEDKMPFGCVFAIVILICVILGLAAVGAKADGKLGMFFVALICIVVLIVIGFCIDRNDK